jgi:Integrase zinc binding domain/Integrase core domain
MINTISIPAIGCGKDQLKWETVKSMLKYVFQDSNIKITICMKPIAIHMASGSENEVTNLSDDESMFNFDDYDDPPVRMENESYADFLKFKTSNNVLSMENYSESESFLLQRNNKNIAYAVSTDLDEENQFLSNIFEDSANEAEIIKEKHELHDVEISISKKITTTYFHCFTRRKHFDKTTPEDIFSTLKNLRQKLKESDKTSICMSNFMTTYDTIQFSTIREIIQYLFKYSGITVSVFHNKIITPSIDQIPIILRECHNSPASGHSGIIRTLNRIKSKYYWTTMREDIEKHVKGCYNCQANKTDRRRYKAPMEITTTSNEAFQRVAMDIVGPLPVTRNNNNYILTFQDDLTKFSQAYCTTKTDMETIAGLLIKFISHYGIPKSVLTDLGSQFTSELMKQMSKLFKIEHLKTTAYHPQTNGALERSHSTLKDYLTHFITENLDNWDEFVPLAMFCYNTSVHSATKFTPYELVFGNKPLLPSSIENPNSNLNYLDYINQLKYKLAMTRSTAKTHIEKAKLKAKETYDKTACNVEYKKGDLVLTRNNRPMKGRKLMPQWNGPFEIVEVNDPLNVVIKTYRNKTRKLHVNQIKHFLSNMRY